MGRFKSAQKVMKSPDSYSNQGFLLVAEAGFEPTTFGYEVSDGLMATSGYLKLCLLVFCHNGSHLSCRPL
jgi:hypothetical protein